MPQKSMIFVANWKMQLPYASALSYATNNREQLLQLAQHNTIVLCPSFTALNPMMHLYQKSGVALGAQNCSSFSVGAYTGEEAAQSLAQLGCTYCIVGHSERRTHFHETDVMVAEKVSRLLEHSIQPIICIGESREQFEQQKTITVLTAQLAPIFGIIQKFSTSQGILFAYEPVWSIGTGIVPEADYLNNIFAWLREQTKTSIPKHATHLLYGGSVTDQNAHVISQIQGLNGFLVGGASLDFQKFKNIVSLTTS